MKRLIIGLFFLLGAAGSAGAANVTFDSFVGGRSGAAIPVAPTDQVLLYQGSHTRLAYVQDIAAVSPVQLNTSAGAATFYLPASGRVTYIKIDSSGNPATVQPSVVGQTILHSPNIALTVQDETVTLQLVGTNWQEIK